MTDARKQKRVATEDETRIVRLLCGHTVTNKRGRPQQVYLKDGSAEEKEARRALARYLRTSRPIDLGVCRAIADLLDPDCVKNERRIRFMYKREGNRSDALAEKAVAEFIWSRVQSDMAWKRVLGAVEDKFGLKRTRTNDIWDHWEPILKRLKRTTPLKLSDW